MLESQFGLSPSHSVAREGSDRFGLVLFCTLSSVEYEVWLNVGCICRVCVCVVTRILRGRLELTGSCKGEMNCRRQADVYVLFFFVCSCGSFQGYRRCTNFEAIQVQGMSTFILPGFALFWHWFWGSSRLDIISSYQMLSILIDMFLCSSLFQELIGILPGR